ncbi:hypothetical protein ACLKA6_001104 [Drosophila palustris]
MIPVDILATEMREIYLARAEMGNGVTVDAIRRAERQASLVTWQVRWDSATNGRWTHQLIPKVEEWLNRGRGEVNFHLTQFLTGHGGFRKYLHKYRQYLHVLYYCTRYRGRAGVVPPPKNLMAFMLATEDNWSSTSQLIIGIQRDLRRCERERRERSDALKGQPVPAK